MLIKPNNPEELKSQLSKRPLVLFGMGVLGERISNYCRDNDIEIACFVDNNPSSDNNIISPNEMKLKYPDANILITSNIYFDEIKKQVLSMGFSEENILSFKMFIPDQVTWAELDKNADWEKMKLSVRQASEYIDENVCSVVDYGAGEMFLKTLLPPNVKYYPVDYIKRCDETILCDLNTGIFPDIIADVSVFDGLLELITTAESFINHVCATTNNRIILTYMTADKFPNIEGRRTSSYVNDFYEQDIIDLFIKNNYSLIACEVSLQNPADTLFVFEKGAAEYA